ncbi:MAG: Gfo/Idh/MocA family oxidoreductase [Tyzzerella sp.]|nr:Gfo/Idh/MocA family oxidoreductase [Tyzzerella sp.]
MKVVVIGLGSMGKRRIRLIQKTDVEIDVIGVDGNEARCREANELYGIKTCININDVKQDDVQCAFVCTSPLSHANIIEECLNNGWHVFTELNLVADKYKENIQLAKEKNCTLFLSSTFFYREEISYIRKKIQGKDRLNYVYHIGQYLPDWHPWENYKDFFVGNERTNGCREIMAIELPWLTETFGQIIDFNVIADKMSELEINYKDNYMIQITHENGNKGALIVDIVCPHAVRNLEIYGENLYFSWNGNPTGLMEFDSETKAVNAVNLYSEVEQLDEYRSFVVENAYQNEIGEFFDVLNGKREQVYGFEKDMKILECIDKIERK